MNPPITGLDTNNSFSESEDVNISNQSYETNLSFESSSNNAQENIIEASLIKSFLRGDKSNDNPDVVSNSIDLVLSVENSKQNLLTESIVQNIIDYKLEINKNLYRKIENKIDMLFAINSNSEKYINTFFENILNFSDFENDIENSIIDKTNKIKTNNFETILKNFILNEESSTKHFSLVSNYFIETLNNNDNSINTLRKFEKVLDDDQTSVSLILNFANANFVKKHNLIQIKEVTSSEFSKDIRSITNDLNIQNIVTMIRNLYFMSPNTLFDNYIDTSIRSLNFDEESLRTYTSELKSLNIFKDINTNSNIANVENIIDNNKINVENISSNRVLKNKDSEEVYSTRNRQLFFASRNDLLSTVTIASLSGIQYLPTTLSDYVNNTMIRDFGENLYISDNEFGVRFGLLPPHSVSIAKETNKLFTGNFFDIDLAKFDILKDFGVFELLVNIVGFGDQNQNIVIEKFRENFVNNANKEIIYKNNSTITNYTNKTNGISGRINAVDRFNLDDPRLFYIDDLNYKVKLDSLVKKNKLNHLVNNDIDLTFANEVVSNIKNSAVLNKMIPYCDSDSENISIIDKDDALFDLLFTKEDEEVYSHIDLLTNHKIDNIVFRGIDSMKKNDIDVNDNYESIKENIKNIISNYYPKNSLLSSSYLYKKLIKSIISEASVVEDIEYEEINLTQCLYFNFFKRGFSDNIDVKKLVAKRFIKKAIQLDTVSNVMFRNVELPSFKYDIDNIIEDDYDNTSESEVESYISDILNSSESLKLIKNNIFGLRNIKDVSLISDFKRVSNIKFAAVDYNVAANVNVYNLSTIINYNLLPNYCMLYNFSSGDVVRKEGNVDFSIDKKNRIKEKITYGDIDEETGEREITSRKYLIDKSNSNFDVTNSDRITVKITPKLCKSDEDRNNHDFPSIVINDQFSNIFKSLNKESFVFFTITEIIQDILKLTVKDFEALNFNNEDEVDVLIDSNEDIINDVITLIELVSEMYLVYTARLQRLQAIKIFSWQKKDIDHGLPGRGTNSDFSYNGIISKHSNVYNTFKNVMSLNENDTIDIVTSDQAIDSVRDMRELIDLFDSSKEIFLENIEIEPTQENFKTHITSSMYNILRSLFISDLSQAFTFDLVNGLLDHQEKLILADRDDITSSEIFDNIDAISDDAIENIESNFYNIFYINSLSKKLLYMNLKNRLNNNYLSNAFDNKSYEYYINKNILKNVKQQKDSHIISLLSNIDNTTEVSKEVFLDNKETYLNSNFSSFGIKNETIANESINTIIKITVNIVDKFNVNRFYIPKVFLFSPMITNVDYITAGLLDVSNNISGNSNLGFFDPNKDVRDRINIKRIDDLLNDESNFLINVIADKLSIGPSEAILVYKYLLNCHVSSNEIDKIMKHVYNVNNSEELYKKEVSEEIYKLAGDLTDKQFFNVFDSNKSSTINNISQNDNGDYNVPSGYNTIHNNNLLYDTLIKLENLSCMSEIEASLNSEYYDVYNIAINPSSFYYVDISGDSLKRDESLYELNNTNRVFHEALGINDFMIDKTCKKSNLIVDNFNIVFNTEIL